MTSTADPIAAVGVLRGVTIGDADAATCEALIGTIRQLRGWVDSVEVTLTTRMRQLHDTAGGAPAADLHTRCGGVSSAEAKRKERRADTIDDAPLFGDALANGAVGAEHVDALANATSKLDDATKAALLDHEHDLLADATRMTPEQFGRSCRELGRRLEHGIERNTRSVATPTCRANSTVRPA